MSDLSKTLERLQRAYEAESCPTCKETIGDDIATVERQLRGGSFLEAGMRGTERRWHVAGPHGAIEAVVVGAPGFGQSMTLAVHDTTGIGDPDALKCRITGKPCWHDTLVPALRDKVYNRWLDWHEDEELLFRLLGETYAEILEVPDVPDVA